MPTIKDVAKKANVSIATVSYVLNNKTDSISAETRQLVLQAAEEIGYTPNVTARNLRNNQTRLIGYAWHIIPEHQMNPIMDQFTYRLSQAAEDCGYHILTFTHPIQSSKPAYANLINTRRVDGFVLADTDEYDPRIEYLLQKNVPFVCFGRSANADQFSWVDVDGTSGVRMAVAHLVELGHERIAMVGWNDNSLTCHYRIQGYIEGMREFGLAIPEKYIFKGEHSEKTGREAFAIWNQFPESERPTGIIAISDLEAIGVMYEAESHGFEIGKTLSVIGFDDMPMSNYLRPALTTLRQPIREVAQELFGMLLDLLQNPKIKPHSRLMLPELIKRASTGRLQA
jgi:LacI family transcriptional regulator